MNFLYCVNSPKIFQKIRYMIVRYNPWRSVIKGHHLYISERVIEKWLLN